MLSPFNPNNKFKETIKELRNYLLMKIKALDMQLYADRKLEKTLNSTDRFLYLDLENHCCVREENLKQLKLYEALIDNLRQNNAKKLNVYNLKSQAYFSVLFCAETFGLSPSKANRNGNPLLKFLEIIIGFDKNKKDKSEIRNTSSQSYQKYTDYKESTPEIKSLITLLEESNHNRGCNSTLQSLNKKFQSTLLRLNLRSKISLNS